MRRRLVDELGDRYVVNLDVAGPTAASAALRACKAEPLDLECDLALAAAERHVADRLRRVLDSAQVEGEPGGRRSLGAGRPRWAGGAPVEGVIPGLAGLSQ